MPTPSSTSGDELYSQCPFQLDEEMSLESEELEFHVEYISDVQSEYEYSREYRKFSKDLLEGSFFTPPRSDPIFMNVPFRDNYQESDISSLLQTGSQIAVPDPFKQKINIFKKGSSTTPFNLTAFPAPSSSVYILILSEPTNSATEG